MTRLLTDDELAELALAPRDQVADALDDPGADPARTVRSLYRGHQGSVAGLETWTATVFDFLSRRGGVGAVTAAVAALGPVLVEGRQGPAEGPTVDDVAAVAAAGDRDATLAGWDRLVAAVRFRHDVLLDVVCVLLSHLYRTEGVEALYDCLRHTGDHMLLSWMPQDVAQPPEVRVRNWAKMTKGNFATISVTEDDDRFVITQDPCGTCGRQILDRGYPGPLDLAVVDDDHLVTRGHGGVPVYRTHVPVLHTVLPREQRGTPWPVIRCPAGLRPSPCQIVLFKDPDDPRAADLAVFVDDPAVG
ncbi:MAG TPA: hypothetical protein VHB02_00250 [Acidimicrobiales bacterium]|nr:hypothetical protein [Acidimicrobiales bacterium]